ncbi:MAG: cysteine dioxygenase family protein [Candidatus Binataceae bacterium]
MSHLRKPPKANTPSLRRLIDAITRAVAKRSRKQVMVERTAEILQPYLGTSDLLTRDQMEPSRSRYQQKILHVAPDGRFTIVALSWLPGQSTPVHNHVAWCVSGIHLGSEEERRYWFGDCGHQRRLVEIGRTITTQGSVTSLMPPGDIHRVLNGGHETSVSLHIYGADIRKLGSSIERRFFDLRSPPIRRLGEGRVQGRALAHGFS